MEMRASFRRQTGELTVKFLELLVLDPSSGVLAIASPRLSKGVLQAPLRRRRRILSERLNPCKAWRECGEGAGRPIAELTAAQARGSLLDAEAVEREWSDVLGTVRAGNTGRAGTIDVEVRAVLSEIRNDLTI